jgi:hypothetical protein
MGRPYILDDGSLLVSMISGTKEFTLLDSAPSWVLPVWGFCHPFTPFMPIRTKQRTFAGAR